MTTSHYSSSQSQAATLFMFDGNLIVFSFYTTFLEECDNAYFLQASRLKFFDGYHRLKQPPTEEDYLNDSARQKLLPLCSYEAARSYYAQFDIKFRELQTDRCETCNGLNFMANNSVLLPTPADRIDDLSYHPAEAATVASAQAKQQLKAHLSSATQSYGQKAIDVAAAKAKRYEETVQIDFKSTNRCPHVEISATFFESVKSVHSFIVCVASTGKNYLFLFDEEMCDHGPNAVVSCLIKFIRTI